MVFFFVTCRCRPLLLIACDRLFAGVNTCSGSGSSRESRSVWDLGADFPTLPDLPVVPWLRFAPDNVGHDGLAAQDGGSAEGAKLLSETTIHGPDDVDPSHVLELPGYDASAASREVTGAGKQSKVVVDAPDSPRRPLRR